MTIPASFCLLGMGKRQFLSGLLVLVLGVLQLRAATYTVTHTGSLGAGSLRQAVLDAEANPGPDIIEFAPALAGQTILLGHVGDSGNAFSAIGINTEIEIRNTTGANITIARDSASNYAMRIFNVRSSGNLTLVNLTIVNGSLTFWGGANIASAGTFTARGCTIKGGYVGYNLNPLTSGGGVLVTAGTTTLINCTVTGNYSGGFAGGIACNADATLNILNCTIAGNNGGGVRDLVSSGTTVVRNSILGNYSFTPAAGSSNNMDASIALPAALAANGGVTETMAISPPSPAVGGGAYDPAVLVDQRGMPRDNPPDIGAFEFQAVPPQITSSTNQVTFKFGENNSFTFTASGNPTPAFSTASPLPNGVTLSPSGVLSGTPETGGIFPLEVYAANGFPPGATQNFTLTVVESPSLIVNTADDAVSIHDGVTSLREAVSYAAALGGTQTITFAPLLNGQTINLASGATGAGDDTSLRVNDGVLTIDGGAGVALHMTVTGRRHLLVGGNAAVTLKNLTLTGGDLRGVNDGAAVWNGGTSSLTINNCRFTGNQAINGGAIWSSGSLTVTASVCESNSSTGGGAILSAGPLLLRDSTFSRNQATDGGYGGAVALTANAATIVGCSFVENIAAWPGNAGGIVNYGAAVGVTNCTFVANIGANGGAIIHYGNVMTLAHCTVVSNTAGYSGGGVERVGRVGNDLFLINNLIALNTAFIGPDLYSYADANNGIFTSLGHNLIGNGDGALGLVGSDFAGTAVSPINPVLGALANNGGPTPTVALLPTSPAIDGGLSVTELTNDQRGFARTVGFAPDIGAFESAIAYNPSFSSWRWLHGLAVDGSQDFQNPSGDGVANIAKYAFNLAPTAGSLLSSNCRFLPPNGTSGLPSITVTSGPRLTLQFVRRKASTNPGIGYVAETSADLVNWSVLELTNALVQSIDAFWERVTVTDPASTTMRFGRVKLVRFDAYRNDFNSTLGAATLRGTALWTNQAVQLTDTIGGQLGAVVFDGVYAGPALSAFTTRFNMNLGPAGQPVPADGVSLVVGDLGTGAWGEGGPGTARNLTISFDTYDNGGDGSIGIRVFSNNVAIASNPLNPFTQGNTVPVEISYDATTGVTVKFNGATIFSGVALPGYSFPTGSKFGIGGRTGGAVERAVVDDVEIITR